jgi:hypothetical protein
VRWAPYIHLARDHRGHFLVYDEHMERLNDDVDSAAAQAIRTAEDRTTGPPTTISTGKKAGPLRYPDLYDDGDTDDEDEDDLEPLDLDKHSTSR